MSDGLLRLQRALELYLKCVAQGGTQSELLEQNEELRDLLEPMFQQGLDATLAAQLGAEPSSDSETMFVSDPTPLTPGAGGVQQLGRYRLLQQIGEGGMGSVFLAEQSHPIRRKVAVKVVKWGMDTKEVLARFEAEQLALALMDHPNIARVFDAGATPEGRPYFVMEHVPGEPITTYCDRNRLSPRERVELFIPICQATQHAHMKGVIHRDLKPSNLLVMVQDGRAVPKIIDFGVAKATAKRLSMSTLHTEIGQLVGTPEYMSPEQAEMGLLDIDTRTDVYSLGVILYELLSGALPFDSKTLRDRAPAEIQKFIREEEARSPSTRVSRDVDSSVEIAKSRRCDPTTLARKLRGELDWIVMKCLEKDRTRRYESASQLAGDLECFLRYEPVLAGPPSSLYRLSRRARKHRRGLVEVAAIMLSVVFGMWWGQGPQSIASEESERNPGRAVAELSAATPTTRTMTSNEPSSEPGRADVDLMKATVSEMEADGSLNRVIGEEEASPRAEVDNATALPASSDGPISSSWPSHPSVKIDWEGRWITPGVWSAQLRDVLAGVDGAALPGNSPGAFRLLYVSENSSDGFGGSHDDVLNLEALLNQLQAPLALGGADPKEKFPVELSSSYGELWSLTPGSALSHGSEYELAGAWRYPKGATVSPPFEEPASSLSPQRGSSLGRILLFSLLTFVGLRFLVVRPLLVRLQRDDRSRPPEPSRAEQVEARREQEAIATGQQLKQDGQATCAACGRAVNLVTREGVQSPSDQPWRLFCDGCLRIIPTD